MLLLGGSSVVNALTGMDIYLASFLIVSAALSPYSVSYSSPNVCWRSVPLFRSSVELILVKPSVKNPTSLLDEP